MIPVRGVLSLLPRDPQLCSAVLSPSLRRFSIFLSQRSLTLPRRKGESLKYKSIEEYNERLAEASRTRDLKKLFSELASMKADRRKPNLNTYHYILEVISTQNLAVESSALLSDLIASGLVPETKTFNLALKAQLSSPLFEETLARMNQCSAAPDENTWELVAEYHIAERNIEMCLTILNRMATDGIAPSHGTMHKIITLAADLGLPRLAIDLVHGYEARTAGKLRHSTWVRILMSSVRLYWDEGIRTALLRLDGSRINLDEGLCLQLLGFAGRSCNLPLATAMLRNLKDIGSPTQEHFIAPVISIHAQLRQIPEAFDLLQELEEAGVLASRHCADVIMEVLSANPETEGLAYSYIERRLAENRPLSIATFNAVVGACYRSGPSRPITLLQTIMTTETKPDAETFFHLLVSTYKYGYSKDLSTTMKLLQESKVLPDESWYSRLVLKCASLRSYEVAFYWLDRMKAAGYKPPNFVYSRLALKCLKARDERAEEVVKEMEEQGYMPPRLLLKVLDGVRRARSRKYKVNCNA